MTLLERVWPGVEGLVVGVRLLAGPDPLALAQRRHAHDRGVARRDREAEVALRVGLRREQREIARQLALPRRIVPAICLIHSCARGYQSAPAAPAATSSSNFLRIRSRCRPASWRCRVRRRNPPSLLRNDVLARSGDLDGLRQRLVAQADRRDRLALLRLQRELARRRGGAFPSGFRANCLAVLAAFLAPLPVAAMTSPIPGTSPTVVRAAPTAASP